MNPKPVPYTWPNDYLTPENRPVGLGRVSVGHPIQGYNAQGLLAMESRIEVKDGKPAASVKTPSDKLPGNQVSDPSALLSALDVSDGTLVPAFRSDLEAYALEVPFDIDSLTVKRSAGNLARLASIPCPAWRWAESRSIP